MFTLLVILGFCPFFNLLCSYYFANVKCASIQKGTGASGKLTRGGGA